MKTSGPDGLEAWSVALAACFINFVMAGLGRMSGILYVAFIEIFQVGRREASVPFSIRSMSRNLLGPVVGIVGQKYGVRAASVAGGIIGTISTASCFYAHNILLITILWGALSGIGAALTTTLNQVILGLHFKKYRTTASGMSFSGGCVGSFIFPVLIEFLLHTYGLGGTFLVIAGITMNVIPAAMMLRKPSWLKTKSKAKLYIHSVNQTAEENHGQITAPNISGKRVQDVSHKKDENTSRGEKSEKSVAEHNFRSKNRISTEFLRQNNRLITLLLTTNFADGHHDNKGYTYLSTNNLLKELEELYQIIENVLSNNGSSDGMSRSVISPEWDSESNRKTTQNFNDKREIVRKLKLHTKIETKEIILLLFKKLLDEDMKNIVALFPEDEHRSISKIIEQLRCIYELFLECEKDVATENNSESCNGKSSASAPALHSNSFSTHIKSALRLHTNPLFLLISLCRSAHFLSFVPAVTIIVDFSMDKGLLEEDGKYVIAALSFGDLVGRLCLGWVTDREYIGLPRYMLIVMILQGVCTASLTLMHSRVALLSCISLFGLLQGSLFVRHPVLVSRYLGKNEQSVAMGCFNFFSGLVGFMLPSYIGYFRDTMGSYNYIFYINGACGTAVGILWFFEPFFVRYMNKRNEPGSDLTV